MKVQISKNRLRIINGHQRTQARNKLTSNRTSHTGILVNKDKTLQNNNTNNIIIIIQDKNK